MKFPSILYRRDRPPLDDTELKDKHWMHIRHHPGSDWNKKDDLPDYTKIKIDEEQSCNWGKLSMAYWVRWDNQGVYKVDYGIVSYSVRSIRKTGKYGFSDHTLSLSHRPEDNNYSHCIFLLNDKLNRTQRRDLRMLVKRNAVVAAKPHEEPSIFEYLIRLFILRLRLWIS